ncbi:hypothetical protein C7445_106150 [Alicyclobacillus sacchari]|uniref:Uncharacterized protein n=1 Tax=Alicyclobacillus sacchari TaxID=392010 RepID=A0A4R8LMX6_9BACL|nr:hypothetical protein [Alicyclobacillus sacchari]TDY46721.1 hypothetical protein C7445_106150 [Alicyclobacillus sacchari]GMA58702.1 hypothetical protein GCM10025858_32050 [Alicyclobacillus sacchari]
MGVFGGYTRWAVVFLIIFVLFFLLCPAYGYAVGAPTSTIAYTEYDTITQTGYMYEGYGMYDGYSSPHDGDVESSSL